MNMTGLVRGAILVFGVVLLSQTAQAANPSAQKSAAVSAPFDGAYYSTALVIFPFELMPGLILGFKQDGRFIATYAFAPECTEGTYTILSSGKVEATVRREVSVDYQLESVFTLTIARNLIFGAIRTTELISNEPTGFGFIVGRNTAEADLKMDEILSGCDQ